MDPETISEIIQAFEALGGEAKTAFVWWLVCQTAPGFLLNLFGLGILLYVAQKAARLVWILVDGEAARLRRAAGITWPMTERELKRACKVLADHYRD
jgi:hypothetical protein